jgi:hypothetical protein
MPIFVINKLNYSLPILRKIMKIAKEKLIVKWLREWIAQSKVKEIQSNQMQ